jgi:hypothetical protein
MNAARSLDTTRTTRGWGHGPWPVQPAPGHRLRRMATRWLHAALTRANPGRVPKHVPK